MSENFKDSPQVRDALDRIRKGGWDNVNPKDVVFYVGANIQDHILGVREGLEHRLDSVRESMGWKDEYRLALEKLEGDLNHRLEALQRQLRGLRVFLWCLAAGLLAMILLNIIFNVWLAPRVIIR
jgi:hypothetical protein